MTKQSKSVEVEYKYLTSGDELDGRIGILPIGSIEVHGPSLPYGTDTLIAEAFAQVFARRVVGIAYPSLAYGFCASTSAYPGTVSPGAEASFSFLQSVCAGLAWTCERLVIVNIHKGNDAIITAVVDDLLQTEATSLYYVNPYTFFGKDADGLFAGKDNSYKEAALLLASLEVLGVPRRPQFTADEDEQYTRPPDMQFLRQHGVLGFTYPDEEAHIAARANVDVEAGRRYFAMAEDRFAELMDAWRRFAP